MKTKTFWFLMIMFEIAVLGVSGYIIYGRLHSHFLRKPDEIRPLPKYIKAFPPPISAKKEKQSPAADKTLNKKILKKAEPEPAAKNKIKALKTIFTYSDPKAKSVSIEGSFSKWKPIKMEKKRGKWRANVWILPGKYLFHYRVDGIKKLDNSKPKSPVGESIVKAGE